MRFDTCGRPLKFVFITILSLLLVSKQLEIYVRLMMKVVLCVLSVPGPIEFETVVPGFILDERTLVGDVWCLFFGGSVFDYLG